MTDPRDLIAQQGAPAPRAEAMPAEIRSDIGFKFQLVEAPVWTYPFGAAVIAEWRCHMTLDQLRKLRTFLVKPDMDTGLQPEAVINKALYDAGIGSYIGTFVAEGSGFQEVRMLFAFQPPDLVSEEALNQKIFALMIDGTKGSEALVTLRRHLLEGANRTEFGTHDAEPARYHCGNERPRQLPVHRRAQRDRPAMTGCREFQLPIDETVTKE